MKYLIKSDQELLIRIIKGSASPADHIIFNEWISQSDKNTREFESLKLLWEKTDVYKAVKLPNPDLMWSNIQHKINLPQTSPKVSFDFSIVFKIAAVIMVALACVIFYNHMQNTSISGITNIPVSNFGNQKVVNHYLVTKNGEKITCVLPDSSVVHLNSQSRLNYPEYFSGNIRIVELEGEAYFSVKHDKNRPFIVKCGNSQVTVTGTEFNIRNRNNNTKIVVANGSVNVLSLSSRKQENLQKGEMVSLDKIGNISSPIHVNLKYYLAWKSNKLAFTHAPLQEVMAEIERTYNLKAEFLIDSAKYRTITGIFETDSLEKVLSVLSLTLDLNISQKGMKIIIR
jgi:transmembrane sensor